MEYYVTLYILYFFIGLTEINKKGKSLGFLCFICLVPLFVLTAFRDFSVGNDTMPYYNTYLSIHMLYDLKQALLYSRMEPGYIFLNYLFSSFNIQYIYMQIFISAFIYYSLFRFLRKYSLNIGLSCMVYLGMRMFCGPMNVVRMWIALAVLLYALDYFLSREKYLANCLVVLATMFHYSALIFLFLNFIYKIKIKKKYIAVLMFSSLGIAAIGNTFFEVLTNSLGIYQGYLNSKYFNYDDNIAVYITLLIDICLVGLFYFLTRGKPFVDSRDISVFVYLVIISMCLDIIGLTNTIMSRISGYFYISWMVLLPLAVNHIRNGEKKLFIYSCLAIGFFLQFLVIMIYRPQWYGVVPYTWYF